MKTKLLISSLVLSTVLGATIANADTPLPEEKGIMGSMADAVKNTASDVKKAIIKDDKEDSTKPVIEEADISDEEEDPANSKVEDDSKDAEANRNTSDSSIAIYSQNSYIQSVMEETSHIKSTRLKELIVRGDSITIVDIRPRAEFAKTPSIKGVTLNIPRNFLEVEAYEKLPNKDATIIIISTKGIRGGLAANTLQYMGYTNVKNLMDGLEGWNKLNNPH